MNGPVLISGATQPIVTRAHLSTDEIRTIAVNALEKLGRTVLSTIHEIESSNDHELYSRSIRKSVLEPIVTALRERNQPVDYIYGSVRNSLALSQEAMHIAFCDCNGGASMRCDEAAALLRAAIELERAGKFLTRTFNQNRGNKGH